jgi:cell volume regulation protein A
MLGLLVSPARIAPGDVAVAALAGLLLTVVARPLSVLACGWVTRLTLREQAFVSWAGLRGAVPIVLSTIPLAEHVDHAQQLFDIVFVMVVIYTVLTGPTLPWAARRLGVTDPDEAARDLEVEAAPLERVAADLLQVSITGRSQLHGVEVSELRLPLGASLSLVVREGRTIVPDSRTVLRHGDDLLVVTPRRLRRDTEDRLRAVSRRGRLAQWLEGSAAPG